METFSHLFSHVLALILWPAVTCSYAPALQPGAKLRPNLERPEPSETRREGEEETAIDNKEDARDVYSYSLSTATAALSFTGEEQSITAIVWRSNSAPSFPQAKKRRAKRKRRKKGTSPLSLPSPPPHSIPSTFLGIEKNSLALKKWNKLILCLYLGIFFRGLILRARRIMFCIAIYIRKTNEFFLNFLLINSPSSENNICI